MTAAGPPPGSDAPWLAADDPLVTGIAAQGARLVAQLRALDGVAAPAADPAALAAVAAAAGALRTALADLPAPAAAWLASAELGFMPGETLTQFLPRHRDEWQRELRNLAAGATAVASWADRAAGASRYRAFLVRGYLRGFAHLWRTHRKSEPPLTAGSPFVLLVTAQLAAAGITDDPGLLLDGALASDWRTV